MMNNYYSESSTTTQKKPQNAEKNTIRKQKQSPKHPQIATAALCKSYAGKNNVTQHRHMSL
jgi:hypothetical protein